MTSPGDDHPTRRDPPTGVQDLTDADVPDFLERNAVAVLAFLRTDDTQSLRVRDRLQEVAFRHVDAAYAAVDVARNALVAEAVGVKATPVILVFRNGRETDRVMGAPPADVIQDAVRAALRPRGAVDSS